MEKTYSKEVESKGSLNHNGYSQVNSKGCVNILSKPSFVSKLFALFGRREKRQFALVMVAALLMAIFQALGVASILPFMNLIMQPDAVYDNQWLNRVYTTLGFTGITSFIIFLGSVMVFIIVIGNIISALAIWLKLRFVWSINHNLSTALLKKYVSMPYVFFLNHNSADLSKNILNEVSVLTNGFLMPLLGIVIKSFIILLILGMLFFVDPLVTIIALFVLGGAYILVYFRLQPKLSESGKKRMEVNRERYKAVFEVLGGIKDIKVMGREPFFTERYITNSRKMTDLLAWNAVVGDLPRYLMEVIAFGGIIILILVMLTVAEGTQQVIPLISLFAFAGYRLMPALQEIFRLMATIQFSRAVLNNIYREMTDGGIKYTDVTKKALPPPLPFNKSIRLDNVTFSYPNTSEPVLKNISMEIHRQTSVAIAGSTGAGKTTFVDIVLGLLTPEQGKFILDDIEITPYNVRNWQRSLGYVPQQIYLSDDTIARNIAFGLPDAEIDRESLEKAARIANLHEFIANELPAGYETMIGERGVRLSGGQRQRVGIARALYHDPEILLLDEATSSLDGITEDAVIQALDNAATVKTLIIVAHRLTTVMNCDVIHLMEKGEIVASGTYNELINSSTRFRAMAKVAK